MFNTEYIIIFAGFILKEHKINTKFKVKYQYIANHQALWDEKIIYWNKAIYKLTIHKYVQNFTTGFKIN